MRVRSRRPIAGLFLAAAVLALNTAAARADATVRLVGHIPPQATIQFGSNGSSTAVVPIDLSHPQGEVNLFNFTDSTNGGESYTISITSANMSDQGTPQLVSQGGSAAPVPFQLMYNGQPLQFQNGVASLKTIGGQNFGNNNGALGLMPLGTANSNTNYTDTLVFNIVAN